NTRGRSDEAMVLDENLPDVPHLQGADRSALAMTAIDELQSEVLVLDDGFQHRRLARDLDLVLIDATAPWGHGYLLPRGLLREPVSGLRRASLIALTRCDQVPPGEVARLREQIRRKAPGVAVIETRHGPVELVNSEQTIAPLSELRSRPVAAFCGIGNPNAFRRTLSDLGAEIHLFRAFPDHHPYTRAEVDELRTWARGVTANGMVVTTQKDLVKLRIAKLGALPLWSLRIHLQILVGESILEEKLRMALNQAERFTANHERLGAEFPMNRAHE
ncbi:MAG: tetraacyldisaccharide 4'-kinase, partial [Candidatus Acidiferrum sp.]